jgi:hypothetical protein
MLEFNNKYFFLRSDAHAEYQDLFSKRFSSFDDKVSVICEYDKPNTPVFKDPTKVFDCGLIGDTGYYFQEEEPWTFENTYYRYVLVDEDKNVRVEFEKEFRIFPCYSTASDCFLLYDTKNELCEWRGIQKGGTYLIAGNLDFNPTRVNCYTHSNRWLVHTFGQNQIVIWRADLPNTSVMLKLGFDPNFRIRAACIVGNRLYLFQPRKWIVVVNLEYAYSREELKMSKKDTYRIYPLKHPFDYVRMTFLGPALCYYGGNDVPIILWIDPNKKETVLVACQVCQVPVQSMCSDCNTPACSEEHLECCLTASENK